MTPCRLCAALRYGSIELYCSSAQRKKWTSVRKQWPLGVKWEELRMNKRISQSFRCGSEGTKNQRWWGRDSDGLWMTLPPRGSRWFILPAGSVWGSIRSEGLWRETQRESPRPAQVSFCFIKQLLAIVWVWIENNELKGFCRHHHTDNKNNNGTSSLISY